jgi:hypothetical protein
MGFPTKVQLIKRKESEQWYINFPSAVAQAMEFERGETVEWIIEDKSQLVLRRRTPPAAVRKKNVRRPRRFGSCLSRTPHHLRIAVYGGTAVCRLVGRLSFV